MKNKKSFNSELIKELKNKLRTVYNRDFSTGFYLGKPINEWSKAHGSKATKRKEYLGRVVNFYKKHCVAEIKLEANDLRLGDIIMFQGYTTGVFEQKISSMQIKNKDVSVAKKGKSVGIKTIKQVRENDKAYLIL